MTETADAQDLRDAGPVLQREWGFVTRLLTGLDQAAWDRPTRCTGWTVRDLALHVVWGVSMEADALRRARTGEPGTADGHTMGAGSGPAEILVRLHDAVEDLVSEVATLGADAPDRACPMPYGETPVPVALAVFVFEAGIHASDFAHAVGEDRPLADDVVPPAAAVTSLFLPVFAAAGAGAPEGTSFALRGGTVRLGGQWSGSGLVMGDEAPAPTFSVVGDDSSVLLFANGRLGLDDRRLRVEGSADLAQLFKTWVPGP